MNRVLCLLQVGLVIQFAQHGWMYLNAPPQMQQMLGLPPAMFTFIGAAELLASVGLVVPALLRVMPWLTAAAAAGLALLTSCAIMFHFSRGEGGFTGGLFTAFFVAVALAYGRWKVAPIPARG